MTIHADIPQATRKHRLHNKDHCDGQFVFAISYLVLETSKWNWFELILVLFSSMDLRAQIRYI